LTGGRKNRKSLLPLAVIPTPVIMDLSNQSEKTNFFGIRAGAKGIVAFFTPRIFLTAVLIGLVILFSASRCLSQAPKAFSYQAVVRNIDGTIRANEDLSIDISIIGDSINGPIKYKENHNTTSNDLGMVTIIIGEGNNTQLLDTVDWSKGPYFLGIEVDGVYIGATQILSVPYALFATEAHNISSLYYDFGVTVIRISGTTEYGFEFDEEFTCNYSEIQRPSQYYENQDYPGVFQFKILATEGTSGNKVYIDIGKDQYSYSMGHMVVLFNEQYKDNSVFSINVKFTSFENEIIDINSFNKITGEFKGSIQMDVKSSDFQSLRISCTFDIILKTGLSDIGFIPYQF